MHLHLPVLFCVVVWLAAQQNPVCSAHRPAAEQPGGSQEKQQRHLWLSVHQRPRRQANAVTQFGRRRLTVKQWALRELDGAVEHGYYYTNITVGNPPQRQELLIDTGSDITFMACAGCTRCGHHGGTPRWNPRASTTARNMSCNDAACDCDGSCGCSSSARDDQCHYSLAYAEGSSTRGYIVTDNFHFNQEVNILVAFGCGQHETGAMYSQEVEGLVGMSNTRAALHAQLARQGHVADVFALCYGWPAGGGIMLGDGPMPNGTNLTYTRILALGDDGFYPGAFSVKLQGITMGGKSIPVNSVNTTILDSGTTLTYVPAAVHQAILAAITNHLKGSGVRRIQGAYSEDICWGSAPYDPAELGTVFPTALISFAGGGAIPLAPERYLVLLDEAGSGTYCLGIVANQPSDSGPDVIIGTVSVRNVMVKYDVEQKRIGFGEADCPALVGQPTLSSLGAFTPVPSPAAATPFTKPTGHVGPSFGAGNFTSGNGSANGSRPLGQPSPPPRGGGVPSPPLASLGDDNMRPPPAGSAAAQAHVPWPLLLAAAVAVSVRALL